MKRLILALSLATTPALAQQPPSMQAAVDHAVAQAAAANTQVSSIVTSLANQVMADQARIAELEKQLADAKASARPADPPKAPDVPKP